MAQEPSAGLGVLPVPRRLLLPSWGHWDGSPGQPEPDPDQAGSASSLMAAIIPGHRVTRGDQLQAVVHLW